MFENIGHSLYITWSTGVGCVLTFKIFVLLLLLNVPTCRDISLLLPLELKRLFLYGFYISSLKDFAVKCSNVQEHFPSLTFGVEETLFYMDVKNFEKLCC